MLLVFHVACALVSLTDGRGLPWRNLRLPKGSSKSGARGDSENNAYENSADDLPPTMSLGDPSADTTQVVRMPPETAFSDISSSRVGVRDVSPEILVGAGTRQVEDVPPEQVISDRSSLNAGEPRLPGGVPSATAFGKTIAEDAPAELFGDLSCMRWTGGTCSLTSCRESRGPTKCLHGKCFCAGGCADARGHCIKEKGEWLGEFAIRFAHPYDEKKPFIGTGEEPSLGSDASGAGIRRYLASSSDDEPAFKIALTEGGHVRFESVAKPGLVMSIHSERRRRSKSGRGRRRRALLQQVDGISQRRIQILADSGFNDDFVEVSETLVMSTAPELLPISMVYENAMTAGGGNPSIASEVGAHVIPPAGMGQNIDNSNPDDLNLISDDDDEWPGLFDFTKMHPLDVTFRVHPTHKDGGGLEIWDPQSEFSLASGNPEWVLDDEAADLGIAECKPEGVFSGCEGRQLVEFEPELPARARPVAPRDVVREIALLRWWEVLILGLCCCGLSVACCAVDENNKKRDEKRQEDAAAGDAGS